MTVGGLVLSSLEDYHDYNGIVKSTSGESDRSFEESYKKALDYGIERDSFREGYIGKYVRSEGSLFDERRLR